MMDASCRGLGESIRHTCILRISSEDWGPFPALYTYPPLDSTEYYLPPRVDHSGDLACDCNSVMYKYETPFSLVCSCGNSHPVV